MPKRGQDFDHVVLGISYDVLPSVSLSFAPTRNGGR